MIGPQLIFRLAADHTAFSFSFTAAPNREAASENPLVAFKVRLSCS
ncbi:MAG: hypothetical protein JO139_00825 [Alphaproteobacteria bacterium]|nr:hypothetical protein [Alphaproteobacteria bacterium]MBV8334314.1 hypothetical protein [Alphaproteobacteria bacterium]